MYILIAPYVSRAGPDYGIVTSNPDFRDVPAIRATFDSYWQPSDTLDDETMLQNLTFSDWQNAPNFKLLVPPTSTVVSAPQIDKNPKSSAPNITFAELSNIGEDDVAALAKLAKEDGEIALNGNDSYKMVVTKRVMSQIVEAPIVQFGNNCQYDITDEGGWNTLNKPNAGGVLFGLDPKVVPNPPQEEFQFDESRNNEPYRATKPNEAKSYHDAVHKIPSTWR